MLILFLILLINFNDFLSFKFFKNLNLMEVEETKVSMEVTSLDTQNEL
jgi:hypothetical protein